MTCWSQVEGLQLTEILITSPWKHWVDWKNFCGTHYKGGSKILPKGSFLCSLPCQNQFIPTSIVWWQSLFDGNATFWVRKTCFWTVEFHVHNFPFKLKPVYSDPPPWDMLLSPCVISMRMHNSQATTEWDPHYNPKVWVKEMSNFHLMHSRITMNVIGVGSLDQWMFILKVWIHSEGRPLEGHTPAHFLRMNFVFGMAWTIIVRQEWVW